MLFSFHKAAKKNKKEQKKSPFIHAWEFSFYSILLPKHFLGDKFINMPF